MIMHATHNVAKHESLAYYYCDMITYEKDNGNIYTCVHHF